MRHKANGYRSYDSPGSPPTNCFLVYLSIYREIEIYHSLDRMSFALYIMSFLYCILLSLTLPLQVITDHYRTPFLTLDVEK